MALTNDEKDELRRRVCRYILEGAEKKTAVYLLMQSGYKKSTINKYWFIFSSDNSKERLRELAGY